ncbi:MAG TPA: hypothetical protein VEF04_18665, partial [Blastocatellia bacterium]|nr:hypothetical protein [Blastocatellia bacterium]
SERAKAQTSKADSAYARLRALQNTDDTTKLQAAIKEANAAGVERYKVQPFADRLALLKQERALEHFRKSKIALSNNEFDAATKEINIALSFEPANPKFEAFRKDIIEEKESYFYKQAQRQKDLALKQEAIKQKELERQKKIALKEEQQRLKQERAMQERIDALLTKANRLADTGKPSDLNAAMIKIVPELKSAGLSASSPQMSSLMEKIRNKYKQAADRLAAEGEAEEASELISNARQLGVSGLTQNAGKQASPKIAAPPVVF